MNPQQVHNPAESPAFNPALFGPAQSQSFEAVSSQAMQAASNLQVAPQIQVESPINFSVDTTKVGQPNLAWQYKDAKAAESAREVFIDTAEAIYIGAFMLKLNQDLEHMYREADKKKAKKELVNA